MTTWYDGKVEERGLGWGKFMEGIDRGVVASFHNGLIW